MERVKYKEPLEEIDTFKNESRVLFMRPGSLPPPKGTGSR